MNDNGERDSHMIGFDDRPLFHATIVDSGGTDTEETYVPVFVPSALETTHYEVIAIQNGRNQSNQLEIDVDAKGYLRMELPVFVSHDSPVTYGMKNTCYSS
jgi:hypothetical protein